MLKTTFGRVLTLSLAVFGLTGCDGGIETGAPKEPPPPDARPAGFEEMQRQIGENMLNPKAAMQKEAAAAKEAAKKPE